MQKYPVSVEISVQWGELDALGHVNHTRFLVWMETARMSLFERIGLAWKDQPEMGPILAKAEVNYQAPVHFPATIRCSVGVDHIGHKSFVLQYVLTRLDTDICVAVGRTVIVLFDYTRGSTVSIPEDLRVHLEAATVETSGTM